MKKIANIEAVKQVIKMYGIDVKKQTRELVYKRFATYTFLRDYTYLSLNAIGDIFEKDHTTVLNGMKQDEIFTSANDQIYLSIVAGIKQELFACIENVLPEKSRVISYYENRIIAANTHNKFKELRMETMIKVNQRNNKLSLPQGSHNP